MSTNFQDLILDENQPIVEGIAAIERTAAQIALITDSGGMLVGILTNGDVRRSLVLGLQTSAPVRECMNREFKAIRQGSSRDELLRLFALGYNAVPVIDEHRRPVGLDTPDLIPATNLLTGAARACAPLPICLSASDFRPYQDSTTENVVVLDASLALYTHATVVPTDTPEIIISVDNGKQPERYSNLRELLDSPHKSLPCVVASLLRPTFGFSLLVRSELPVYLGLGGNTALAMCVIAAFNELRAEPWSNYEMRRLAYGVQRLSHNLLSGRRDEYPFLLGGFNLSESGSHRNAVNSIRLDEDVINELEACLILCVVPTNEIDRDRSQHSLDNHQLAQPATSARSALAVRMRHHLLRGEVKEFGSCLDDVWAGQLPMLGDRSQALSKIHNAAIQLGALGGKLLGSGPFDAFLFFVDPRHRAAVSTRLSELGCLPRSLSFDSHGVRSWRTKAA